MKLFVYNLNSRKLVSPFNPYDTGIQNSYSGDVTVVDWDADLSDDSAYFGVIETQSIGGKLMRLDVSGSTPSKWRVGVFLDTKRPIVSAPLPITNVDNERTAVLEADF